MAFQFLCPQGHLLQGEESQTGQQCRCPYCGSEFLVPPATGAPAAAPPRPTPARAGHQSPVSGKPPVAAPEPPEQDPFPGIRTGGDLGGDARAEVAARVGWATTRQESPLHIPCPRGHMLETPRDMLGKDAICPFCRVQFRLRFEDSQEYRREQAEQRERREQQLGKAWMHWAIAAAVVVVLGVILLVAVANMR